MKRFLAVITIVLLCSNIVGCSYDDNNIHIAATTLPVYEFSSAICEGTGIHVDRLINEEVSCLHDYTLQVKQMRTIDEADTVIISGAGLEDFLDDVLQDKRKIIDASAGIPLLCSSDKEAAHDHQHETHQHINDPHIWLSPANAKQMATNIYIALSSKYPQYSDTFKTNYNKLCQKFDALINYADESLADLDCRSIVTFHDGFQYMAAAFDLSILRAIEEEAGREASATELIEMINIVSSNNLNAIFTEKNSSSAAATVVAVETGAHLYTLDMAMSGDGYFTAMYHNIDTLKEALK